MCAVGVMRPPFALTLAFTAQVLVPVPAAAGRGEGETGANANGDDMDTAPLFATAAPAVDTEDDAGGDARRVNACAVVSRVRAGVATALTLVLALEPVPVLRGAPLVLGVAAAQAAMLGVGTVTVSALALPLPLGPWLWPPPGRATATVSGVVAGALTCAVTGAVTGAVVAIEAEPGRIAAAAVPVAPTRVLDGARGVAAAVAGRAVAGLTAVDCLGVTAAVAVAVEAPVFAAVDWRALKVVRVADVARDAEVARATLEPRTAFPLPPAPEEDEGVLTLTALRAPVRDPTALERCGVVALVA